MNKSVKWNIIFLASARRQFKRLDQPIQKEVVHFLETKLGTATDPLVYGKLLAGNLKGIYSFRVSKDYRILCKIEEKKLVITVVKAAHRKDVYKTHQ